MEIKSNSFDVWMSHLPKGGAADKVWEPPVCVFEDSITRVLDLYNEVFFFLLFLFSKTCVLFIWTSYCGYEQHRTKKERCQKCVWLQTDHC